MAYRNHRDAASRPSIYQTVTDRIISSLKAGVIPWEKISILLFLKTAEGWLQELASLSTLSGMPSGPAMNDPSPFGPTVWLCPKAAIVQKMSAKA